MCAGFARRLVLFPRVVPLRPRPASVLWTEAYFCVLVVEVVSGDRTSVPDRYAWAHIRSDMA